MKSAGMRWILQHPGFETLFDSEAGGAVDGLGDVSWTHFDAWVQSLAAQRAAPGTFARRRFNQLEALVDARIAQEEVKTRARELQFVQLFEAEAKAKATGGYASTCHHNRDAAVLFSFYFMSLFFLCAA
jgi:hypothetical protein